MPSDKSYWAIVHSGQVRNHGAFCIRSTRTEVMKEMAGPEEGYEKRWRKIKRWESRPRIVRVTVTWDEQK